MTTNTFAADRTALLIVDPHNDFLREGGKFYEATKETAETVGFYDNNAAATEKVPHFKT
jgi:nicotinamidase-related amidase